MPPMGTRMPSDSGGVTPNVIHYYQARARGGVAAIIVEGAYVSPERTTGHLSICSDTYLPGLNLLAESIQEENCFSFIQLNHGGECFGKNVNTFRKAEINKIITDFGEASLRAKRANFNGIGIHSGGPYLMNQFISPFANNRNDEFGRNLEGRIRLPLLVLEECRNRVGDEFPIFFRINATDFVEGGWDVEQSIVLAKELEKRKVTVIDVTAGGSESRYAHVQPMALPRGFLVPLTSEIKKAAKVPVMAVGRINNPELAEEVLEKRQADLIGIGRGLIADPDFPVKALKGQPETINQCIACNYCRRVAINNYPVRCTVNPFAGREGTFHFGKPGLKKNIWVIGGGPAGMTASRILDERGHKVSLFEAKDRLGGQIHLALTPPYKDEINNVLNYLIRSLEKSKVKVFLKRNIKLMDIKKGKPDIIIIATGVKPFSGEKKGNGVLETSAHEILEKGSGRGKTYLIVGGGAVGCETAEFLADRGNFVTVIDILPEIANDVEQHTRTLLLQRLNQKKVHFLPAHKVVKIADGKAHMMSEQNHTESVIDVETVVYAYGTQSNRELYEMVRALQVETYLIGDAYSPRRIVDAVFEGTRVAYRI
jgi:2,4-dienoyl-CoA reductase-like NADH-dependent reductase (Old Yellow Enzyme family)/thioredoxin reductase